MYFYFPNNAYILDGQLKKYVIFVPIFLWTKLSKMAKILGQKKSYPPIFVQNFKMCLYSLGQNLDLPPHFCPRLSKGFFETELQSQSVLAFSLFRVFFWTKLKKKKSYTKKTTFLILILKIFPRNFIFCCPFVHRLGSLKKLFMTPQNGSSCSLLDNVDKIKSFCPKMSKILSKMSKWPKKNIGTF